MVLKKLSTIYKKLSIALFAPLRETFKIFYHYAVKYLIHNHFHFFIRILLLVCFFPFNNISLYSQTIPQPFTQNDIYSFLDDLDADINLTVKPLSRNRISNLLNSVDPSSLNSRQQKELSFYLKDFNKEKYPHKNFNRRLDALYLRDSLFSLTINPIGGGDILVNSNGYAYHWYNGLYANASIGNWSFYANLTDNHESEDLMGPSYLTQRQGGANIKRFRGGKQDYWDSKGGVIYAWNNGHIGLIKDNFSWGSGYNGSTIFSGRTPSFAHLTLNLRPFKWFEFNYIHGWLVSEVVDSSRSFLSPTSLGVIYRNVYHRKFVAANLFTFKPIKGLNISAGNAIIYDYDNAHPAYFIPVLFWKAVDHHLQSGTDNMNSMLFMDFSVKLIPHTHAYATVFVDEMAVKRIFNPDEFNFLSIKGGVRLNNIVENVYVGGEYTWTNVLTFRHYVPTLTFESNRYNLGHYLTDNARELYLTAGYKPFARTDINVSYTGSVKGPDHTMLGTPRVGIKPFTPVVWESDAIGINASWQIINDIWVRGGYSWQNIRGEQEYLDMYTPEFMQGKQGMLSFGVSIGR